jgi:hypothetical protein
MRGEAGDVDLYGLGHFEPSGAESRNVSEVLFLEEEMLCVGSVPVHSKNEKRRWLTRAPVPAVVEIRVR